MAESDIFRSLLGIIDKLIVPILGYVAYVQREIRNELRALNGRMIKQEQWSHDHDKLDTERFMGLKRELERLGPEDVRGR